MLLRLSRMRCCCPGWERTPAVCAGAFDYDASPSSCGIWRGLQGEEYWMTQCTLGAVVMGCEYNPDYNAYSLSYVDLVYFTGSEVIFFIIAPIMSYVFLIWICSIYIVLHKR